MRGRPKKQTGYVDEHRMTLRLPNELFEQILKDAQTHGLKPAQMIRLRLMGHYNEVEVP